MEISLLTPKCTLVPSNFFDPSRAKETLEGVAPLAEGETVEFVAVPQYDAVLLYATGEDTARIITDNNVSDGGKPLPEMYFLLRDLERCREYNKILCSWQEGVLYLCIAQGRCLLLSNTFKAADFTTAQYYIFLAMKSLQLNPEVSSICWRSKLGAEEEMSLYRYFKSVDSL